MEVLILFQAHPRAYLALHFSSAMLKGDGDDSSFESSPQRDEVHDPVHLRQQSRGPPQDHLRAGQERGGFKSTSSMPFQHKNFS